VDGARATLAAVMKAGPSPLAAIELGRLELRANRPAEAVAAFEAALRLDPSGGFADRIAFGGATPTDALVRLYGARDRHYTALALAAARGGFAGEEEDDDESGEAERFVFEPEPGRPVPASGLAGLDERNAAAIERARTEAVAVLAEEAAALGRWGEAVAYARARVTRLGAEGADRAAAEKRLADLQAALRQWERRLARTLRVGQTIASDTVTVRDLVLD
jgi:hypothetical protein